VCIGWSESVKCDNTERRKRGRNIPDEGEDSDKRNVTKRSSDERFFCYKDESMYHG
jgi:hypothetical protein